jgi:sirohydrochlorin ferrochelatase
MSAITNTRGLGLFHVNPARSAVARITRFHAGSTGAGRACQVRISSASTSCWTATARMERDARSIVINVDAVARCSSDWAPTGEVSTNHVNIAPTTHAMRRTAI